MCIILWLSGCWVMRVRYDVRRERRLDSKFGLLREGPQYVGSRKAC